jgi:hypothetical protein
MKSRSAVVLLAFLFTIFSTLAAQTFRGTIQGTVTDPTGAAVPAAQVKVSSAETGFARTVTTNDQGEYVVPELPLGTYSITVSKQGLTTTSLHHVPVSVGAVQRADVKLTMGEVHEQVTVDAEVPMVETNTDTLGGTIEGEQAAQLPVNGRDFTKLLELVPGAVSDPVGSTESAGSYGLFSVNGNRGRSNNYLLDGTDMNDGYRNLPSINEAGVWGCPSTILPIDALAEVPVTASPDAEFGRSSGATVNLVTKSGTNQIHGSFYEYYRDGALDARNFFNTTEQPKDSFTNHQFGASLGGPIVKDKTFWFFSYEGQRENGGLPQLGTIPTQADIAAATPAGGINPVIQNLLAMNPWGPLPASGSGAVTFTTPFSNNIDSLIFKVDQHLHLFSDSDLLTGRYYRGTSEQSFPLGMLYTGSSAPGYNTSTPTHVNIVSLSYTSAPKSNLIFELRGGYNRFLQDFYPQDGSFDPASIGLDTLPPGFSSRDYGMPTINVSGANGPYSPFGATGSDSRGRIDTNYQLFGNVSLTKGTHSFKWGYEFRRTFINSFIDSGHRGSLDFASLEDFLAGNIDGGSSASGFSTRYTYQNSDGVYFQDSWRVTPRLTMNYGLRWEYFGVVGEQSNQFSLFNPATDSLINNVNQLYPKDYKNFAPRLSFAYDALGNGKVVVRAGYGIFYDGASQDFFVGNQPWNTNAAEAGPAFNNIQFAGTVAPTIVSGQPIFSDYSASSAFTVDQNLTTPYYQSYNLNIESQVTKTIALQIGYVGSLGRHLFRFRDINQVDNQAGTTYSCGNGTSITYGQNCFPNFAYINRVETTASSSYNSLQAVAKIRNWHGLNSTLNYTWSHSIDNASDGLDFVPNASQPDNSFNPAGEFASSNFDVRQRVQWFWSYNLPNRGSMKWLSNGWSVDGILNFATGQPYTVSYLFENDYNGSGEWFGRPDIIGNPYVGTGGANLLNLSAFAAPCLVDNSGNCIPGTQHPGSEGRNAFNAPNYTDFDFSLTKTSHLTERLSMQLRADFFNIFNHPNLGNPLLPGFAVDAFGSSHIVGNTAATCSVTNPCHLVAGDPTQGANFVQTTTTPDVGSGNPYLGGGGPRTIQLSARFMF